MENMPARNGLAITAMVLGILSLFLVISGLSMPLGALGVIVALLSRGSGEMNKHAKIGMALSLLAITLGICVLIWAYKMMNSAEMQELLQQYQSLYGLSDA